MVTFSCLSRGVRCRNRPGINNEFHETLFETGGGGGGGGRGVVGGKRKAEPKRPSLKRHLFPEDLNSTSDKDTGWV